ncbi:uncharacterized protein NP_0644A [Natronomonas pharaonis DSM 2160]|uniref:Uncharacterized protein n=1 Tax=Natronomonas pharaonis (strain ATCC 35678 / DSM 2160 / CIP 103997 / JCM 8858 / NBRC 14720 / NCIMB 2260 / Gabara) TaxID=348780 RepID=A0A1U7EU01_NATPD|nr:uncharacterized protein NP_0644A [Natronomonas pharaonis DSM 2160]
MYITLFTRKVCTSTKLVWSYGYACDGLTQNREEYPAAAILRRVEPSMRSTAAVDIGAVRPDKQPRTDVYRLICRRI